MVIVLVTAMPTHAQLMETGSNPSSRVRFEQNIDVFDWRYLIGYGRVSAGYTYRFGVDIYTSMTERSTGNRWKDNQVAYLAFSKRLSRWGILLSHLQVNNFHDELSAFNYDRKQAAATMGVQLKLARKLTLQPEAGYRWEFRPAFEENGPYAGVSLQLGAQEWGGYRNEASGVTEITRFPQRKNANARLNYTVFREFSPGTWDSLAVSYDYFRRDNFFANPTQGNLESLRKEERRVVNTLRYQISDRVSARQSTSLGFGRVSIQQFDRFRRGASRRHDDFHLANTFSVNWRSSLASGQFLLESSESSVRYNLPDSSRRSPFSRRFASIGYDLTERQTRIAHQGAIWVDGRHSIHLAVELAKLQHDNSDTSNSDSHDELRWQFLAGHRFQINEAFSIRWEIGAFLKHFVYLDGRLSSQNNWKRLIQLQPALSYSPGSGFVFSQRVGVRTQYVDFDFEGESPQMRSYVIRDFFLVDSLVVPLSTQLGITATYRLELEELGSLNWENFSSRPRTRWQNHWFTLLFSQEFRWPLRVRMGTVFYLQKRWDIRSGPSGGLQSLPAGRHLTFGPMLQISYQAANGSTLYFSGQRQRAYPFRGDAYFLSHIQLMLQWTF